MFINGTLEASKSYDYDYSISNMNTALYVGRYSAANAGSFIGYVDDIRISNKARYETTGFTAPSSAFTNDENTILLIASNTSNGSTTFVDSAGAVQNEDGTRTSYVSANTTYGQSIVSATMPSSGTGLSLGHGLSSKPDMIMLKSRSETAPWYVWHKGLDSETQSYLKLNETDTYTGNTSVWNNTAPTSSVFSTVSNYSIGNDSKAIAYCFHDVTGYSKFDSYTGNGSTTVLQ